MGQQQILLIVLVIILIFVAVAVGITAFQAVSKNSHIDAIIYDMNHLAHFSYQYYIRSGNMGGGGNSYTGIESVFYNYLEPGKIDHLGTEYSGIQTQNAIFFILEEHLQDQEIKITAVSRVYPNVFFRVSLDNKGDFVPVRIDSI